MSSQTLPLRSMSPRHSSLDLSSCSSFYGRNTYPLNTAEGVTHTRASSWPRESHTHEDKALPRLPRTQYHAILNVNVSNSSKSYQPYRAFSPYTLAESLSSNTRHTWHVESSASKASSPQLHLTDFSKSATARRIDIYKTLPPIKIIQHTSPKSVVQPSASSPRVVLTIETPTPTTPHSPASPKTAIFAPLPPATPQTAIFAPISPPPPPTPQSPKPKYGDERFHTLPEEAYSWIDVPRKTTTKNDDDSNEQLKTLLARKASAVKEQERPFWRAAIEPTIDPRSGMNYFEQRRGGVLVR